MPYIIVHGDQIEKCLTMHGNWIVALRFNFSLEYLVRKKKDEHDEQIYELCKTGVCQFKKKKMNYSIHSRFNGSM